MLSKGGRERGEAAIAWMTPSWPSSGGVRDRVRDFKGVEAPWPLSLARKITRQGDQVPDNARLWRRTQGRQGRGTGRKYGPATGEPPRGWKVPGWRPRAAKVEVHSHRKLCQTQTRGAGIRDERWSMEDSGCRWCPGERRCAPGWEVVIRWKLMEGFDNSALGFSNPSASTMIATCARTTNF